MKSSPIPVAIFLYVALAGAYAATAKDAPVAVFDAAKGLPADQGWIEDHDKEFRAEATLADGVLRIEDDDAEGPEGRYYRFEMSDAQRALAREVGFVYRWRLRIPQETDGVTRAISTEVCVSGAKEAGLLRLGLQIGRQGNELVAGLHSGANGWVENSLAVDDLGGFHDWHLVFDGQSGIVNLLVDGKLLLAARVDHRDRGHDLAFGSRATGTGISDWHSVRLSPGIGSWKLTEPPPTPLRTDVFTSGEDGYHSYRIPSLITAPNGDLLLFCEGRKENVHDDGDIDLLQKCSTDGGKTWQPQTLVYEEGGSARIKYGNPTTVVDTESGVIWLAVNRDHLTDKGARAGGTLVLFRSDDSGASWQGPIDITAAIKQADWGHYAFGPGIGIQVRHGEHRGRLLLPANYRKSFNKRQPSWSHVIYSDDHGETWQLGGQLADFSNECQLVEIIEDGKPGLLFNARNHWGRGGFPEKSGNRLVARSFDGGASWDAETMDPALPEPPCQASLLRYSFAVPDGSEHSIVLFANPAGRGRSNLKLRLSRDEGRSWPHSQIIAVGSAAYSCMSRLADGDLGIVYERNNYGQLSFARVSREWLMQ